MQVTVNLREHLPQVRIVPFPPQATPPRRGALLRVPGAVPADVIPDAGASRGSKGPRLCLQLLPELHPLIGAPQERPCWLAGRTREPGPEELTHTLDHAARNQPGIGLIPEAARGDGMVKLRMEKQQRHGAEVVAGPNMGAGDDLLAERAQLGGVSAQRGDVWLRRNHAHLHIARYGILIYTIYAGA